MSRALPEWLDRIEADALLREPSRLRERLDALDRLELYADGADAPALQARLQARRSELESINQRLYADLRRDLRAGRNAFAPWIEALEPSPGGDGYDYRDDLVSGILALDEPANAGPLPPDMVFYQPTPARHVFDLVRRAKLGDDDVLVDLGAGLGIVPLLVAMTTGARTVGVEREEAYVDASRRCAEHLGVSRTSFECADAREADLTQGTLFYLYTPFTGSVMRSVLDALRAEAARRALRIATFGPCTRVVAAEPWLRGDTGVGEDRVALFEVSGFGGGRDAVGPRRA